MKRLTKALAVSLAITSLSTPVMASSIGLNINGALVKTTVAPYQSSGTTLVPLRVVSENLGAKVDWNQKEQKVTITQGSTTIVLTLDSKTATVNGVEKTLNLAPQIKNNTTMVPIRFVSENLNCTVSWDKSTQTVSVTGKSETIVKEDGVITVKNPEVIRGVPVVTLDWMETHMGVNSTWQVYAKRWLMNDGHGMMSITKLEDGTKVRMRSSIQPFEGVVQTTDTKDGWKYSIDAVAIAFEYDWKYDSDTKILTITKLDDIYEYQDRNSDQIITSGRVLYMDGTPASNVRLQVYTFSLSGAFTSDEVITMTDTNGYYSYKYTKTSKAALVEVQYNSDTQRGSTIKYYNPTTGKNYPGIDIYIKTVPTFYIGNK